MIQVGLFITKNKDKYLYFKKKLTNLLSDNNKIQFVFLPNKNSVKKYISTLNILLTYNIEEDFFNLRSDTLKWIHIGNAGVDNCLIDEVLKSKVIISNSRGINSVPVSEYVMSTILYFSKQFQDCIIFKKSKKWTQWEIAKKNNILENKFVGIIGYGAIGKEIAKKSKAFNMKVIAIRRLQKKIEKNKFVDELMPMNKLNYLLAKSDFVIIACPLTPLTRHMINKANLKLIRKTSYLINISRGEVINENDLIRSLKTKKIKGAALDVFSKEPLHNNSLFFNLDNVFISPHISGNFKGYQESVIDSFADNLNRYLSNKPLKNRVCKKRMY
tara:strand:+ start:384 stop:1370 length:987 start_codon:yes stop_codon:yes gene_type:complete